MSKEKKSKKDKDNLSRRQQKKRHRLYYKVMHQSPRPNVFLYGIEVFFAIILEIIRVALVFLRNLIVTGVVLGGIVAVVLLFKIYPTFNEWNKYAERVATSINKDDFSINESSQIFGSNGELLATVKEDADTAYLAYNQIPQYAIDAFVSIEDRSFWTNPGYDVKGIASALLSSIKSGDDARGASTITQQLVKNTYLTNERSIERKVKEILISRTITKQFSKRDIMEFYINDICYANGIYGLAGASKAYFNKDVKDLSLSQIAYLCAIPNRPSYYDPYKNPNNALERRDKILEDMFECGYISHAEMVKAKSEKITIERPTKVFNNYETTFAVDCAIKYLMKIDGFNFKYKFKDDDSYNSYHTSYNEVYAEMRHKLYTGGYKVYTTLDTEVCNNLQSVLDEHLAFDGSVDEETGIYELQGAITCIDNETGKVIGVVGGRSQEMESQTYSFNRAYQSYRQPGSTFKPIAVYTPAMMSEYNYTPDTIVHNIDVSTAKKTGVDAQKLRGKSYTLRNAVEWSRNGVAWQVFDKITPKYGMEFITSMQFSNICEGDYYDSSSLGGLTYGATTVEMASAYATLANHGDFREPTCISSIKDNKGKEIYKGYESKEIYTDKSADDMVDILKGVLTRGTASKLKWGSSSDIQAFAKTGTTNDSKDGWLCGATPYYTISVWVGYDHPKTLSNLYGATYPGQIWKDSMLSVIDGLESKDFERNEDDESYRDSNEKKEITKGYYSYLEGRDDSEVLSGGYTVADYRNDRVIGEDVQDIVNKINRLDMSTSGSTDKLEELYKNGLDIISTIFSRKYTNEMTDLLEDAYNSKKN